MQRFYLENLETTKFDFVLDDKDLVKQITKVLRWEIWDKFIFFNGEDFIDYIFEVKKIEKKEISFEQVGRIEKNKQIKLELNLFQAIPNKLDKIELIIKNWTQIWITNFLFFKSERSQKLNITDKKIERLKKIILESSELCGRNIVPNLIFWNKIDFNNLEWKNIFLHTKSPHSVSPKGREEKQNKTELLKDLRIEKNENINLFVWPEWGFSDDEVWKFEREKCERVFLWDNILRTELAWISASFYLIQNNL